MLVMDMPVLVRHHFTKMIVLMSFNRFSQTPTAMSNAARSI